MDRRKFLIGSGAAAIAAAGFSRAGSTFAASSSLKRGKLSQPRSTQSNDLTKYTGPWTDIKLRHLLRRAMFGVPVSQFLEAKALGGMSAVVDKLLEDRPIPEKPAAYVDSIIFPDKTN